MRRNRVCDGQKIQMEGKMNGVNVLMHRGNGVG